MRQNSLAFFILFIVLGGCATGKTPVANQAVDVSALDSNWSLLVVTLDEDGDKRVTRIWIAIANGVPAIRTNERRWWKNLERDPAFHIRLDGVDYPVRAVEAVGEEDRIRIDEAFADKYGGWETLMFPQERGASHEHFAWVTWADETP